MHPACIDLEKHPDFVSRQKDALGGPSPDAREPRSGLHLGIERPLPDEPARGADIPVPSP